MNRVDFVVIGVQKSATTWLYECLKDHPELDVKKTKDERYYFGGDFFKQNGSEWYFNMFQNNGAKKTCVSVDYFVDPSVPKMLHNHNKDIRLLISLRDRLERSISSYYWYLRKSDIAHVTLDEAFSRALKDYKQKKNTNYSSLIERSLYAENLKIFLDYFTPPQFKIIPFESIKVSPHGVLSKVYNFYSVDDSFIPDSINTKPKLNTYTNWTIHLQRLAPKSKAMGAFINLINNKIANKAAAPIDELSKEIKEELLGIFSEDQNNTNLLLEKYPDIYLT